MYGILVNEKFDIEPIDWQEEGEIATYNSTDKCITIQSVNNPNKDRYYKQHSSLTLIQSFKAKFNLTKVTGYNLSEMFAGSFNLTDINNNILGLKFTLHIPV